MGLANTTLSADGDTTAIEWPGGPGHVLAVGSSFGGGTLKLQWALTSSGTYVDYPSGSLTANGLVAFNLPPCFVALNLNGATAPSITVAIRELGYGR